MGCLGAAWALNQVLCVFLKGFDTLHSVARVYTYRILIHFYFFNRPFFCIFFLSVYIIFFFFACCIGVCLQNALYSYVKKTSKDIFLKCVRPAIHHVFVSLERRHHAWLSKVCFSTVEKHKQWIFSKLTCRQKTVLSDFQYCIHKVCQASITHTPTQCVSMYCWRDKALCDLNWFSLNRNKISVLENLN